MRYFKKLFVSSLLILSFILIGCNKDESGIKFNDFIEQVNRERENEINSKMNFDEQNYLYTVEDDKEGFTDDEFDKLIKFDKNSKFNESQDITHEEALEDVEYLFKLLRYGYGAYGYYGGDNVFNEVKSKIIDEIKNKNTLVMNDIFNSLKNNLSFIDDGHFAINNVGINSKYKKVYISNEEIDIYLDASGYYIVEDKEKWYLKSIDDNEENLNDYLKVSINEEGNLVYHIGILKDVGIISTFVNLRFVNNSKEMYKSIILNNSSENMRSSVAYEETVNDSIPIISVRKMQQIYADI